MMATWRSTGSGSYCGCFRISTRRAPRLSCACVDLSRSLPNCANAASSRYCARSSRSVPATCRIALTCAEPPTRDTELPTLIAGRTPWWNRSDSRKIWPSVIEMTLVGIYADRSPACVSMIGGRRRDDDGVAHRIGFFERPHDLRDRGLLLADGVVDADDAGFLLIENRVDRERRLSRLPVADDQLALAAADRHHRVDRLQPSL